MSIPAMKRVWFSNLPPGPRFCCLVIADHAGDVESGEPEAYPSVERVADMTGYKPRTVIRHLVWLWKEGWLSRRPRGKRVTKNSGVHIYTLHIDGSRRATLKLERARVDPDNDWCDPAALAEAVPAKLARGSTCQIGASALHNCDLQEVPNSTGPLVEEPPVEPPTLPHDEWAGANGVRTAGDWLKELEMAADPAMLKWWKRREALEAIEALIAEGFDLPRLVTVLRRMPDDEAYRSRQYRPQLSDWLVNRQFLGWVDAPPSTSEPLQPAADLQWLGEGAATADAQERWARIQSAAAMGDERKYLFRSYVGELDGAAYIVCWSRQGAGEVARSPSWPALVERWRHLDPLGRTPQLADRAGFASRARRLG